MAERNRSRNKSTDKPAETNSEEKDVMTTPVTTDETVTPETVSDETNTNSETVSDETNSDEVTANEDAKPTRYPIPANPNDLTLSDPDFATAFGRRILNNFVQVKDIDAELKAAAEGDSTSAVVSYAESADASVNIQGIYSEYSRLKAEADSALAQLTAAVKTEKGDVQLSDQDIADRKNVRKTVVSTIKHAIIAFREFAGNNDAAEDIKLFADTVESMIGGRSTSTANKTPDSGADNRPRLGDGGYVQVGEEKFKSFTPAIKAIRKAGAKSVVVPDLHNAWVKTVLGPDATPDRWNEIPANTTTEFNVGSDDSPVKITVYTEYTKAA